MKSWLSMRDTKTLSVFIQHPGFFTGALFFLRSICIIDYGASENFLRSNHPSVGIEFKYSNQARGAAGCASFAWAQFCVSRDVIILLRGWAAFYWLFMACSPHDGGVPHLFESTIPQRCTQREKSAWFWQHSSFIDWRSTRCWKFVTRSGETALV